MKTYGFRTKCTINGVPAFIKSCQVIKRRDTTDSTDTGTVPDGSTSPRRERTTGLEEVEIRISAFMNTDEAGPETTFDLTSESLPTIVIWPHGLDFPADTFVYCMWDEQTRNLADPTQLNNFEFHGYCSNWEMN